MLQESRAWITAFVDWLAPWGSAWRVHVADWWTSRRVRLARWVARCDWDMEIMAAPLLAFLIFGGVFVFAVSSTLDVKTMLEKAGPYTSVTGVVEQRAATFLTGMGYQPLGATTCTQVSAFFHVEWECQVMLSRQMAPVAFTCDARACWFATHQLSNTRPRSNDDDTALMLLLQR